VPGTAAAAAAAFVLAAGSVFGGPGAAEAFYEPRAGGTLQQHPGEGCGVVLRKHGTADRGRHCPFPPPANIEAGVAVTAASVEEFEVLRRGVLGPDPAESTLPLLSKKSTEEISMLGLLILLS